MVEQYLIIDGTPTTNYGVYVSGANFMDSASEDVEDVVVAGRNGVLHINNNRLEAFTLSVDCYIKSGLIANVEAFKNWLLAKGGSVRLEHSYFNGVFRLGRYKGGYELDTYNTTSGTFTLEFVCKPELYLTSGETETTLATTQTITNPTLWASKPLIRVKGNGTLTINGENIVVNTTQASLTIDSEMMNCYNGAVNCNNDVTLNEFPTLKAGANTISYTGFSEVKLISRWWRL